ncbi:MAG: chemotaxis protein CheW [Deltaproteobacteria bacterium]
MEGQARTSNQFVIFCMNHEEYGIDIQKVTTIEKLLAVTRVPHAPEAVKGVINLRGEIIPVVELAQKLRIGSFLQSDDTRIIIFKIEDVSVGFIVDEVAEVLTIPEENIENITQVSNDIAIDYILGIGKIKGKIVTLLNLDKLITLK